MSTTNSELMFQPVQCTSQTFANLSRVQDGFLYFLTDTKQIFLSKNGSFINMCGGLNIVYGQKTIEYVNNGVDPDPNVVFSIFDLEKREMPLQGDLILNTDGCFYRVESISGNDIFTTRLTLQGTGGGGSSDGGGGTVSSNFRIDYYNGGEFQYFAKESTGNILGVVPYSNDSTNYLSKVELSWDDSFKNPFFTKSGLKHPMGKVYPINIDKYLTNISSEGVRIYLRATDSNQTQRSFWYTVSALSLSLTKNLTNSPDLIGVTENKYSYRCNIGGQSHEFDSRIIEYKLYSDLELEPIFTDSIELGGTETGPITKTLDLTDVPHGDYFLQVQATGEKNGIPVPSNTLTHKLLRYREDVGTPIFSVLIPEKTELYTKIPISFLLLHSTIKEYELIIEAQDHDVIQPQYILPNQLTTYNLEFENKSGFKEIQFVIDALQISFLTTLNVTQYTGALPVINSGREDLRVYFSAKGRNNQMVDKAEWPNKKDLTEKAILNNFHYGVTNGWLKDKDGVDCLKLSSGASVTFDDYLPFETSPRTTGMTIELDFSLEAIRDYDTKFIECLSYAGNNISTGFVIEGDTFKYYAGGQVISNLKLAQSKRIKLTYVIEPNGEERFPMCLLYLDGIISNAVYSDQNFSNSSIPAKLIINSASSGENEQGGGEVYIYNIRFYTSALSNSIILGNYQATLPSLEERQDKYYQNKIFTADGENISLEEIAKPTYNLQIPYVKIFGGYSSSKKFKMGVKEAGNVPKLPNKKSDFRAIDIEIHYPTAEQNPYFAGYKDFNMTTEFSEDPSLTVLNGFGKTPKKGAMMYAQGTSSLEYPVKNLRVKLKTESDEEKFIVRPGIAPVELVTFKADFMESSGSHNTGAANYIDDVYSGADMQTPGQQYFEDKGKGDIVTCIKGHPCIIFWNPGVDENGNELSKNDLSKYQFIGKYNYNLDKATPEPFGFMHDDSDFGYLSVGDTYVDEKGNTQTVSENQKINSIYCFEFLDNAEFVCNFQSDLESKCVGYDVENETKKLQEYDQNNLSETDRYKSTWYDLRRNENNEIVPGWARGFESRYPDLDEITPHSAEALKPFAFWLNSLYNLGYIEGKYQEAVSKFKDEYQYYLDPEYTRAYYLITETLLMADSRVKNMMIATWGPEERTWTNSQNKQITHKGYIWYPIFYDMDTMLGLDNIGYVNKNYYDEDTQEDVFNGACVLWKFVRDALKEDIKTDFSKFENSNHKSFTPGTILPYFNDNQSTMANESIYNEDAYYKYIDTFRTGWIDDRNDQQIQAGPGENSRLYAAQGNRSLSRDTFVKNRINYLKGKYLSADFQENDQFQFRLTVPTYTDPDTLSDEAKERQVKINASIAAVPPSGEFDLTSTKIGYACVKVGTVQQFKRFSKEETQTIDLGVIDSANGTETYIMGASNLKDLGDLSTKYLYQFASKNLIQNNLTELKLGNHHRDYYNPYWENVSGANLILTGYRFLSYLNLENCIGFTGAVDCSSATQIERILLNGSSASTLKLPVGGAVQELRIPSSIVDFNIDSHTQLTNESFTIGNFVYDTGEESDGLSGHYENDFSKIQRLFIKDMPQIDTFNMVKSIDPSVLSCYSLQNIDWTISNIEDLEIDENNNITGILVLNMLKDKSAYVSDIFQSCKPTLDERLIGNLTINIPSGYTVNEYTIYERYHNDFPNLNINYAGGGAITSAIKIEFFNVDTVSASTEPYYVLSADGSNNNKTIQELIDDNNIPFIIPTKASTNDKDYSFSYWNQIGTTHEEIIESGKNKDKSDDYPKKVTPKRSMRFAPVFTESPRLYEVIFYNSNGTVNKTLNYTFRQPLDQHIDDDGNFDAPVYCDYSSTEQLENNMRQAFKGLVKQSDFNNGEYNYIDESIRVTSDMKLHPHYEEENAIITPTNAKYFNFTVEGDKYTVSFKKQYRAIYNGILTLPKENDGKDILRVGVLSDLENLSQSQIKKVFFEPGSKYEIIGINNANAGFWNFALLTQVDLSTIEDTLTKIESHSFQFCYSLVSTGLEIMDPITQISYPILPDGIISIGREAFKPCGKFALYKLPKSIVTIGDEAFQDCSNIRVNHFGNSGSNSVFDNNLQYIGAKAFSKGSESSSCAKDCTEVYLYSSIETIGTLAFNGYGNKTSFVIHNDTKKNDDEIYNYFGRTVDTYGTI